MDILSTKLYIPRPRTNLVARPRLHERLNAGLERKLILIAAPAGFGKTTLLGEWIISREPPVAWCSLDDGDDDPDQFWTYFITALERLRPGLGDGALALLHAPQTPPIQAILTTLVNAVTGLPEEVVLVLDDFHVIRYPPIHEAFAFLLDHLPPNLHLIVTTRSDPPLPLARLRAHDELIELRANDLRFSAGEAEVFLRQSMGLSLPADHAAALAARTDGWIAGLQIAALSLNGRDDVRGFVQAFSGSHRYILGYLAEEVLAHQSPETVDFLLQTSILDRLCGPLCDALTGRADGQATLAQLERANLFLMPLDEEGAWYRYHQLFAEVLRLRLKQARGDEVPRLHARAQRWLAQNGWGAEAVQHALAGQDFDEAARLIEQVHGAKWRTGEIRTLRGWLAALPEASRRTHPRLWLVEAWVAMTVGDFETGAAHLEQAEEALRGLDAPAVRAVRPEITAVRACHASLTQNPAAIELAHEALAELPPDYWLRGLLVVFLGAAYYSAGDLQTALATLEPPMRDVPASEARVHDIHLLALTGVVQHARGCLRLALSLLHRAVELAEPGGRPIPYVGTLFAYMSLAPALYERGESSAARDVYTRCEAQAAAFGSAEVQIYSLAGLARVSLALGDRASALELCERMEALLDSHTFSSSIMAYVDYARFLVLHRDDPAAAAAWAGARPGPLNAYAFHRLALPQALIARGSFEPALAASAALVADASVTGHGALLIKALALQALASDGLGQREGAMAALERALGLAGAEGFVRSFVDEGEPMRRLLLEYQGLVRRRLGERVSQADVDRLAFTELLLAAFARPGAAGAVTQEPPFEPLSARELDILRLIAAGRSNQEIAGLLVIASSTVKSHINSLYGKLGAQRRTQAVLIARERGLLTG